MIIERIATWWANARDRVFATRADEELHEEMATHLSIETARLVRDGYDEMHARAIARERFGDLSRFAQATRDERRSLRGMDTMQDIRYARRVLSRNRGFTMVCLLTLAVGIGAATAAFTVFDAVLLRPLPYHEPDRLMLLREMTASGGVRPPSYPNFVDWREQSRTFSGIGAQIYPYSTNVVAGRQVVRASVIGISRGFLDVLGVTPAHGRTFRDDEHVPGVPTGAMVSHEFWMQQLGGNSSLGHLLVGDFSIPIIGVLPPDVQIAGTPQILVPLESQPSTIRSAHNHVVYARLADGATIDGARAEMATISTRLRETYGSETEAVNVEIVPVRDDLVGGYRLLLTTVFGAAVVVLLIACTNLVSAQLARGLSRHREISIRGALGASRARILRQLFVESVLLSVVGAAGGVATAYGLTKIVTSLGAGLVPRLANAQVDLRILAFAAVLTIATSILVGLYPAFRLSKHAPGASLRAPSRSGKAAVGSHAWSTLVGFEIALAVMLVIGSTLLVRTMRNIMGNDVGFDPRGIVTAALSPAEPIRAPELSRLQQEMAAVPGVSDVAFVSRYPLQWGNESGPVLRPTDPPDQWPAMAGFRAVSAGYFEVMQQRVLRGRSFSVTDDSGTTEVAIVTSGLAERLWPGEQAVGRIVRTNYLYGRDLLVVGVVAEATSWRMPRGEQNEIFVPIAQHPSAVNAQLILVARTAGTTATLPAIRARLGEVLPLTPATVGTMEERISRSASDRRFAALSLGLFATVALLLAGIGVYGVFSYTVAARTHEIGVRMALGASPTGVRLLVLRGAAGTAVAGVIVGVAGSAMAGSVLQSLLYGVTSSDPITYGVGVLFLLGTALLAAFIPARRASRIDPLVAIRTE